MLQRPLQALLVFLILGALGPLASAQTDVRIRVMLHPDATQFSQVPTALLDQLQALAGVPLSFSGSTRTGGLEFSLPQPLDPSEIAAAVRRLQQDRSVLWAEVASTPAKAKAKAMEIARSAPPGRKLMIRLADDAAPDWATLLPRLQALTGMSLAVDHQIGNVWVLSLDQDVSGGELADIASQLETDPAVRYADPVQRATINRVPNDPMYPQQWALSDPVGGVNAPIAWNLQTGSASLAVAVVDTGVTAHPELAGRVLPGYDFVDNRPGGSDTGDGTNDSQCNPNEPGKPSSWHGTFVSGLIAANTNNGSGIAGMDWNARILPVRVLGPCGGTFDNIASGVLWAAGLPVFAIPPNPNPARVINMSLGGPTACPQALQEAIDSAMAQGAVVTVAAGNESYDATGSAPANCSGVITVGASTRQGDRASYSNFGGRVDLSAPGGDIDMGDWILSTSNDGSLLPGNPSYAFEIGTSFAAPHVAGTASLIFARNRNLTPGQVLSIVTTTARTFPSGSVCSQGTFCGVGLLDAGLALQSTVPAVNTAPPGTMPVIEYYRSDLDHYFMTADPGEIAFVDSALYPVFQRTGEVFFAWVDPAQAPLGTPLQSVCRFYSPLPLINSHIYTASDSDCQFVIANSPGTWILETTAAFYVVPPDGNGACPNGTLPVYRFFDNRVDANQRHTVDLTVRRAMLNRGWASDGLGPNGVAFCSPF